MAVLDARSHNEAMLYVVLRACRTCGERARDITDEIDVRDGAVHTEYAAVCRRCGDTHRYVFRLPERDPQAGVDEVVYGGSEPSKIIDAGEWLGVADRLAAGGFGPAGPQPSDRGNRALALAAAAAVDEVLKFIPVGADRVPLNATWTDEGKEQFARDPGRMRRARMEVLAGVYRSGAARRARAGSAAGSAE